MRRNYNVIKINGIKGLFVAAFIIGCLIAGFLTFPGWVCMNLWNFAADMFPQMPQMQMIHGILLWCILGLSLYALNRGNFAISIGGPTRSARNEERIKELLKQINENNASIVKLDKKVEDKELQNELFENDENEEEKMKK